MPSDVHTSISVEKKRARYLGTEDFLVNPTLDLTHLSETMALQEIFTIAEQLRPTVVLRCKEIECFFTTWMSPLPSEEYG
ncbi:hypothetical protein LEMLEM_LOCUS23100 [Lemmus lemmus]